MQTPPINAVHGVNALDANTVPIAGAVQTLSTSEDTIQAKHTISGFAGIWSFSMFL